MSQDALRKAQERLLRDTSECVRLFLADLSDLRLADARQASELRHHLRQPDVVVLRKATVFLAGLHPPQTGQDLLVRYLRALFQKLDELEARRVPRGARREG